MATQPSKNYKSFLKMDLSKTRPGQYVVLVNGKLFKKGKNVQKMLHEAEREYPGETPFIAKMPPKGVLVV